MLELDLDRVFDDNDPKLKSDMLHLIVEYLHEQKLHTAASVLQDEANMKNNTATSKRTRVTKLQKCIISGDWETCIKLISKISSLPRLFHYHIYRQQYLEFIDSNDFQRAYAHLMACLKPLEDVANAQNTAEFAQLCYLLTCKSVREGSGELFSTWTTIPQQRHALADRICTSLLQHLGQEAIDTYIPPSSRPGARLVELLRQSVAYQVAAAQGQVEFKPLRRHHSLTLSSEDSEVVCSNHTPRGSKVIYPCTSRLLYDYQTPLFPTAPIASLYAHTSFPRHPHESRSTYLGKYTCMSYVGPDANQIVVGTDYGVLAMWDITQTASTAVPQWRLLVRSSEDMDDWRDSRHYRQGLVGENTPKIRDVVADSAGNVIAAAVSDGSVFIIARPLCSSGDLLNNNDISKWNGVDSSTSSWETKRSRSRSNSKLVGSSTNGGRLRVHGQGDCMAVAMTPFGDTLISGGFDQMVAAVDLATLTVIREFRGHNAAVTQVTCNRPGNLIYSSSRDGTIKCWDLLSGICINSINYTGKVNASSIASINASEISSVSLSRDGCYLLMASKFTAPRLIDIRMNQVVAKYITNAQRGNVSSFFRPSFCAADKGVIAGTSSGIGLWNTVSGEVVANLHADGQKDIFRVMNDYATSRVTSLSDSVVSVWSHNSS